MFYSVGMVRSNRGRDMEAEDENISQFLETFSYFQSVCPHLLKLRIFVLFKLGVHFRISFLISLKIIQRSTMFIASNSSSLQIP